jgi:hypothetical protein
LGGNQFTDDNRTGGTHDFCNKQSGKNSERTGYQTMKRIIVIESAFKTGELVLSPMNMSVQQVKERLTEKGIHLETAQSPAKKQLGHKIVTMEVVVNNISYQ